MSTVNDRFWAKVNKDGPVPSHMPHLGKCWIWTGYKQRRGYGLFWVDGKCRPASHASWLIATGHTPGKWFVCHHCDNPPCVNPDHLFLGDHQINADDRASKGRKMIPRTHCGKGHSYDEANTVNFVRTDGTHGRRCRICYNDRRVQTYRLHIRAAKEEKG